MTWGYLSGGLQRRERRRRRGHWVNRRLFTANAGERRRRRWVVTMTMGGAEFRRVAFVSVGARVGGAAMGWRWR